MRITTNKITKCSEIINGDYCNKPRYKNNYRCKEHHEIYMKKERLMNKQRQQRLQRNHIPTEIISKCQESQTLYACSIKHSYEDNPIIPLDGIKNDEECNFSDFRFLNREYFNVKEHLEIGSIINVEIDDVAEDYDDVSGDYYKEYYTDGRPGFKFINKRKIVYNINFNHFIDIGSKRIEF